ncbi:MAG TPA: hypothetical protein VIY49_30865 [Bryobacteraceae bacterium]
MEVRLNALRGWRQEYWANPLEFPGIGLVMRGETREADLERKICQLTKENDL